MVDPAGIRDIIAAATLAPSSHNTQPWVFGATPDSVTLFADRARALPVNDPDDRELTISCGCALMNIRIAAAGHGLGTCVHVFPDSQNPDALARITFDGRIDHTLAPLWSAVPKRHTYRKTVRTKTMPDVLAALDQSAQTEGAWLKALELPARNTIAQLVAAGDTAQWSDPRWRNELATWMRPRTAGDGLVFPRPIGPVARWLVRTFDMGAVIGAKDRAAALDAPLLLGLGTSRDTPIDWLNAGQALQRTLLVAAAAGLQASFFNQPIQVPQLRPKIQRLCMQPGAPQILLRLGIPNKNLACAPRRKLSDVFRD